MFHPAPAPTQQAVEQLVARASKRILRFLQRRAVITLVTAPGDGEVTVVGDDKPKNTSRYICWSELLRRTFGIETVCQKCQTPLRLIALIKTEVVAKKILTAMHLPTEIPELHPARPPPTAAAGADDWVN